MPAGELVKSEVGWAHIAAIVAIILLSQIVPIVIGLLTPGRKGKMLTLREADWKGMTPDEARQRLVQKLASMRFLVAPGADPSRLAASRPSGTVQGAPGAIHTHGSKPLRAEFEIVRHVAGVCVKARVWMPDFVFLDTGEGRHIDRVLEELLAPPGPPPVPEPPVPNRSYSSYCAMWTGIILLVIPAAMALLGLSPSRAFGLAFASITGAFVGIGLAVFGLRECIVKPAEIRGKEYAIAAIVLCVIAVPVAFIAYMQIYPGVIPEGEFWTTLMENLPSRRSLR
jgi:hypothetical protein